MLEAASVPVDAAEILKTRVNELHKVQSDVPVYLKSICAALNIQVLRRPGVDKGKAYLRLETNSNKRAAIWLPIDGHPTWDRFCAAHEIDHFFLINDCRWNPVGAKEYWSTEVICDNFARELLIPDRLVKNLPRSVSSVQAMINCNTIARTADVPWSQAAKRISLLHKNVFFFRVDLADDGTVKVSSSSLTKEALRSTKIQRKSELAQQVRELIAKREAGDRRIFMSGRDIFNDTKLGIKLSELRVRDVCLQSSYRGNQIKIAAVS